MLNEHEELLHCNLKVIAIGEITAVYNSSVFIDSIWLYSGVKMCIRSSVALFWKKLHFHTSISPFLYTYT